MGLFNFKEKREKEKQASTEFVANNPTIISDSCDWLDDHLELGADIDKLLWDNCTLKLQVDDQGVSYCVYGSGRGMQAFRDMGVVINYESMGIGKAPGYTATEIVVEQIFKYCEESFPGLEVELDRNAIYISVK